jgi:hypothetical protein
MKKLFLSILVICSLLGGNAFAANLKLDCNFITRDLMITFKKTFDFYATDGELDVFVNNIFDTIIDDP